MLNLPQGRVTDMLTIDVHIPDITGFKVIARYETQAAVIIITASSITKCLIPIGDVDRLANDISNK